MQNPLGLVSDMANRRAVYSCLQRAIIGGAGGSRTRVFPIPPSSGLIHDHSHMEIHPRTFRPGRGVVHGSRSEIMIKSLCTRPWFMFPCETIILRHLVLTRTGLLDGYLILSTDYAASAKSVAVVVAAIVPICLLKSRRIWDSLWSPFELWMEIETKRPHSSSYLYSIQA